MSLNTRTAFTKIQTTMTVLLFIGVELLIVILFYKRPNFLDHDYVINVYSTCFLISAPGIAGLKGIRLVKRMSSRSEITDITKRKLNRMFLDGIGFAYVAVGLITIVLARSLR